MREEHFKNIFLSNIDIDNKSYPYLKLLMTNIILYLAMGVFLVFFFVNVFIHQKVLLGIVEGLFIFPTLYTWYHLRNKQNIEIASSFAVWVILFAAIATIIVAKAQAFSILWSITLPFVIFVLKGNQKGGNFLLFFYSIILPYIYMQVGEALSLIEFIRFLAVTVVIIALAYFFEKSVRDTYHLLHESNKELSYSHQQIQSSIRYATNIQRSFLAPCDTIAQELENNFVLWFPKDIVSGDLYLFEQSTKGSLFGIVDCTGHGVAGGFMTMLVGSSFKKLAYSNFCDNPGKILQELNKEIRSYLNQDRNTAHSDDGLDIGLCFIDNEEKNLTFAGAKIDLIYIKNDNLTTIKGNRQSLGYKRSKIEYQYTNHNIALDEQNFYLYTDGIVDQVGGSRGFSYGNKGFKNFLLTIQDQPFKEQKISIIEELNNYQGDNIRRDDITVIGFKVMKT